MSSVEKCSHIGSINQSVGDQDQANVITVPCEPRTGSTPAPPLTWRQIIIFLTVGLSYICNMMSFSILAPFFPLEAVKKGVTSTETGFIFGSFNLIIFLTSPIFGKYLPIIGAKYLFLAGVWISGGCNLLFGILDEISNKQIFLAYCFAIRAVEAIGSSASITAAMTIVANTFPHRRAQMVGLMETFAGFGFMIGPPIGSLFYSIGGYKLPFIVLGTTSLTMVAINILLLPSVGLERQEAGSVRNMFLIPALYPVTIGIMIGSASLVFLDPTLSFHLSSFDKVTPELIGVIFLLFGGFYGALSPLWGFIADKKKNTRTMMVIGYFFLTIAFVLVGPTKLPFIPNELWVVVVGVGCVGLSLGCALVPSYLDMLTSALWYGLPDDLATQGIVSGLFTSSFSFGAFIGPTVGGLLVDLCEFQNAATIFAGLNFFVTFLICIFSIWEFRCGRGRRPPWRMLGETEPPGSSEERRPLLPDLVVQNGEIRS